MSSDSTSTADASAEAAPAPVVLTRERRPGEAPIKPEFLKPVEPTPAPATPSSTTDENGGEEARSDGGKKRGGGGTFKKRPADAAEDPADSLCRPVAADETCPFGDTCKFNHDVSDYLKRKPKDLGTRCPVYDALGYCRDGLACRFAMAHAAKTESGGFRNVEAEAGARERVLQSNGNETNALTNDVRTSLRKNKYVFRSVGMRAKGKGKKQQQQQQQSQRQEPSTNSEVVKTEDGKTGDDKTEDAATKGDKMEDDKTEAADESPLLAERKPVDFSRKIYVAPLTTVGNLPFRRLLKQAGADITCGEMALATNLLKAQQSEWALLRRHSSEDVFGVQLAGAHGDQLARVCELLARETDVDFVDINMGCPIDLVCRAGAGSALMTRPPRLLEVVSGALTGLELGSVERANVPGLTVKLRTGWSEKSPVAHKLVSKIQSARGSMAYVNAGVVTPDFRLRATQGVDAVTIHGRSRLQRYTKYADWDYVYQCADTAREELVGDAAGMPFIGGGDVLSYQEFDDHLKNGKLATCMLGRGALIKPWLPTEIKERRHWDISASERLDMLRDFVNFGLEHWGSDQKGVNRTRRYLLEWQSFLCRYIPIGLLEVVPQLINERPAPYYGRNDLESLMASDQAVDWIKISEMLLGPVPAGFEFVPKHKANAYVSG